MPAAHGQRNALKVREANFPTFFIPEWKRKAGPLPALARRRGPLQHLAIIDELTTYYLTSTFSAPIITCGGWVADLQDLGAHEILTALCYPGVQTASLPHTE
jgi:hypothetical protein